jgi:hypothetical protein
MENDLNPLLLRSASFLFKNFGAAKKIFFSSDLPQVKDRSQRVIAWLRATLCDTYLLVNEKKNLIEPSGGYNLSLFRFTPHPYHQQYKNFTFPLSALDILLNEGPESAEIMKKGIDILNFSQ